MQLGRKFSALQVVFLFEKQENVLIRVLICGPMALVWVAGNVPAFVVFLSERSL